MLNKSKSKFLSNQDPISNQSNDLLLTNSKTVNRNETVDQTRF